MKLFIKKIFSKASASFMLVFVLIGGFITANGASDSKGTDFWLMFNRNYTGNPTLTLFITSDVNTSGTVEGLTFATINYNVTANTVTSVVVPSALNLHTSGVVDNNGIHVTAQNEVTVYGLNRIPTTTDAYLGLPTDILGTDYRILTYKNTNVVNGVELGVVATQNGTTVTITPSASSGLSMIPFSFMMNQGQSYELTDALPSPADLTGTLVTADKPIGVFGASQCANIPAGQVFCDHIVEMLPPTTAWGKNFVTVPLKTRLNGDTWRMICSQNSTTITINGVNQAPINAGDNLEVILTGQSIINSDKPILVAQYSNCTSYDNVTSDPFEMLIPPHEQFLPDYTVTTPATGFSGNYINISAPNAIVGTMTLDGVAIPAASFTAIGASGFSGAQISVSLGSHHLNGSLPFGCFVYGFDGADSYGYPGGQSLSPVATVSHLVLTPPTGSDNIGNNHCWEATVTDQFDNAVIGVRVDFNIHGPHNGLSYFAFTDANGVATFCYTGDSCGLDSILASSGTVGDTAVFTWICCDPPVVTCRNVTISIDSAGNSVTVHPLVGSTGQLSSQTKGIAGACPGSPVSTGVCDCPPGYVATGYSGQAVNGYGNVVSNFRLKCRELNPDGSMGAGTAVTCVNGAASGSNAFNIDASSGEAIVGFSNRMGCGLDQLKGLSKPIADIIASTSNASNNTMTAAGGSGGGAQPTQVVPDGMVVVGMQTFVDNASNCCTPPGTTAGYAWRYASIVDVMKGIGTAVVDCGLYSATLSQSSFDCSDVGVNTITLTVTDMNGNTATCQATVTVIDAIAPTAKCKNVSVTLAGGSASISASDVNNGSTDNCGIQSISLSKTSFNCSNIENNTVILTVTDNSGNTSTCQATVTVIGVIPSCSISVTPANNTYTGGDPKKIYLGYGPQSVTLKATGSGGGSFTYSWAISSCPSCLTGSGDTRVFTPTSAGNYLITVTITNSYGCTATCTVYICVRDIRSGGSGNNQKVYLCHLPPGNPNNPQTLNISVNAVPAHLGNHTGDALGTCGGPTCGVGKTGTPVGEIYTVDDITETELIVYPNPNEGIFTLEVNSNLKEPLKISVYNYLGQEVYNATKPDFTGSTSMDIDLSNMASSYYMVKVEVGGETLYKKVIVVKD